MIICPECNLKDVKAVELNYAKRKREGEPAAKGEVIPLSFFCYNCKHEWEADPKCEPLYQEYVRLEGLTRQVAVDKSALGTREITRINGLDILNRTKVAKKLVGLCKSSLNLPPGEWLVVERNAK